jgi:hypothetical protein
MAPASGLYVGEVAGPAATLLAWSLVVGAVVAGSFILLRPGVRKRPTVAADQRMFGIALATAASTGVLIALCIAVTGLSWWAALIAIPGIVAATAIEVVRARARSHLKS